MGVPKTDSPRPRKRDAPPPRTGSSEAEVLTGFLNYLRDCVIGKVRGIDDVAARSVAVPSGSTLAGCYDI